MKKFFITMFACVFGVLIAGFIFFTGLMISLAGISLSSSSSTYTAKPNTILHLDLSGSLTERSEEDYKNIVFGSQTNTIGLDDVQKAIRIAKDDANISGIYIETDGLSAGIASLGEIRKALIDFKESGKFIYAYSDNMMQSEYYLASVADSVILNPVGSLLLCGLSSEHIFYTKVLEKAGIEMQIFKVGTYKSAVEPFIATEMSRANREQTRIYIESIWNDMVNSIAESRHLSAEQVNEYANTMMLTTEAEKLVGYGLIDALMYRPQMEAFLKMRLGIDENKSLAMASVKEVISIPQVEKKAKDQIAIVYAVGEIDGSDGSGVNTQKLVEDLVKIAQDKEIKAVVLRVNSPGGSAFGSEQVWAAVEEIKAKGKKVVVSMGDLAASGGYYISCNADRIFAEPTTLTGSIGIFGMIPCAEELLTDKIGLRFDNVKTNKFSQVVSLNRKMTAEEKANFQAYVNRGYELFVSRCAEGRGMTTEAIKKIAEGRVWDGRTAQTIGLVDELGGMDAALAWVADASEIENYSTVVYPKQKELFERIMEELNGNMEARFMKSYLGNDYKYYRTIRAVRDMDPIQCRMEEFELR